MRSAPQTEAYFGWRLGAQTGDFITENDYAALLLREGREDAGELVGHSASDWLTLPRILRPGDVGRDHVFVDLGCGEGRMLLEAARRYPFKRVVGVELSGQLAAVASRNVAGHGRIEVVRSNVLDWPIPPDTSVFYLYNPFKDSVFARTIARIIASADAHPGGSG